ncbi:MAG TPA: response regulator [Chloroflexota bacterium]|nr:response regulator [Chloroflexota bacterium]
MPLSAGYVLLVEDDDAIRQLVSSLLRETGLRVQEAADAAQALRFCSGAGGAPGLIILDLGMPAMDGESLLDMIRQQYGWQAPVLILSAMHPAMLESAAQRMKARAMSKPFDLDDLVAVVHEMLGSSKAP